VKIARASLMNSKLLIADEPILMLGATLKLGVLKLLLRLKGSRSLAIMFITRDMGLAYYASNRALVMYRGEIIEEGKPEEIMESPRHQYTKHPISDVPSLYR